MEEISELLESAQEYGLLTEVVYSALEAMKENPELEPHSALAIGLEEWDT
jgi:hypothetical protein